MKAKFTLILVLILVAASVWYFKFYQSNSSTSFANLVPQSSVGVITASNPSKSFQELSNQPWWDVFLEIPFLSNSIDQIQNVQTLVDASQLESKLNQLEHSLSLHITANDQIETLHFVKSDGFIWSVKSIKDIIGLLWPSQNAQYSERLYESMVINELKLGTKNYSFLIVSDYLVFTTNAILIEDVIRTTAGKSKSLFDQFSVQPKRSGGMSFVLNMEKLDDLARVFFMGTRPEQTNSFKGLLQLDLDQSDNLIALNGIIPNTGNGNSTLLTEIGLNERDYLPNGISQLSVAGLVKPDQSNMSETGFDLNKFLDLHSGSLTQLEIDAGGQEKERAMLAMVNNPQTIQNELNDLALELVKDQTDTLYQEQFMNASITFLNKDAIVNDFYGTKVPAFEQCYYAVNNNMLVLGESVDVIKLILREYDDENTWGKIVPRRQFLDDLIQKAALTKLINFQSSVDGFKQELKPKWKAFFVEQQRLLDLIDLVSVQMTKSGDGYYVSNQMTLNPLVKTVVDDAGSTSASTAMALISNTFADGNITSKPFVVRNHNNANQEILYQDENRDVYLVSKEGTMLWKKRIGQAINGSVSQIDFFDNRKLQYLFSTDSAIYLIDRNGDDVEGFPKALDTELPILNTSVIDYDNSKRYRYLGIDRRGSTYLFDQQGQALEGWNPRRGTSSLLASPEHIRVRGKDCFVFVRTDGTVELTNRRGEAYDGFPFKAGKRLAGDFKLKRGPDFGRTTITIMTEDGLQLEVDFNGSVKQRVQLFKPAVSSGFSLIPDRLASDHIIVRKDSDGTVFFDASGSELFSTDLVLDRDDQISFYNFRNESEIYVVNQNGQLHLLDKSGKPKLDVSVETDFEVGVVYYQNRGEYELFINFENQFAIYRFAK